ncbi:MAG: hypothetical protein GY874_01530 [Desulfobacteraceae bacterium]|nr:hypothetical protein [Desulfobacteraceae bacterium]
MDKSSKQNLANDIETRLDNFFGANNEEPSPQPENEQTPKSKIDNLNELKSIVLSIDWEITDQCLTDLITEAESLLTVHKEDRSINALLRMLKSLGKYVRKTKAQAHPDAIKRILAIYDSLEKLSDPQSDDKIKKQMIVKEVLAFKSLKNQIETQKLLPPEPAAAGQISADNYVDHQTFKQSISTLNKKLMDEIRALKKQLEKLNMEIETLRDK